MSFDFPYREFLFQPVKQRKSHRSHMLLFRLFLFFSFGLFCLFFVRNIWKLASVYYHIVGLWCAQL